jgi:2-dehydro-3-deoxygalactonokinase
MADRQVAISRFLAATLLGQIVGVSFAGVLADTVGWRGIFWTATTVASAIAASAIIKLPETKPRPQHAQKLTAAIGNYGAVLRNPLSFVCFGTVAVEGAAIFGWLPYGRAASAYVAGCGSMVVGRRSHRRHCHHWRIRALPCRFVLNGTMETTPNWIAVDWGTTNLRAWSLAPDGTVLCAASSAQGMSKLARSEFEPALLELVGSWLPQTGVTPVIACGMVGARQGWVEAPYQAAPCAPLVVDRIVYPTTRDSRLKVAILPGVSQAKPHPDVMRGEETQIAGFLSDRLAFEGVVCLPGTHTKWVRIGGAGKVLKFQTFMTGELFDLLRFNSVLRHSLDSTSWDQNAFNKEVISAFTNPPSLAARLFSIRADTLLSDLQPSEANARLSGSLIGAELAAARDFFEEQEIVIIGSGVQADVYTKALGILGKSSIIIDAADVTLGGLKSAFLKTQENSA